MSVSRFDGVLSLQSTIFVPWGTFFAPSLIFTVAPFTNVNVFLTFTPFVTLALREYTGQLICTRDSGNVDNSVAVVLSGCTGNYFGLDMCGMCGFENCRECRNAGARCVFTVSDLGIAVGSAVSVAADHRIDNRVMYSVGRAALKAGMMPDDTAICYGIPLAISSKSIFFDRGPGAVINTDSEE